MLVEWRPICLGNWAPLSSCLGMPGMQSEDSYTVRLVHGHPVFSTTGGGGRQRWTYKRGQLHRRETEQRNG